MFSSAVNGAAVLAAPVNISIKLGTINPVNMSGEQSKLLCAALLTAYLNKTSTAYFPAGPNVFKLINASGGFITIHSNLTHPVLARMRENDPNQLRFEVIDKFIGSGNFSTVYLGAGTLVPQTDGSLVWKNTRRVIKKQIYQTAKRLTEIEKEYQLACLTPHLHAKRPVCVDSEFSHVAFMVGRLIPGITLDKYIAKLPRFSPYARLSASLAIVNSVIHLHENNIIHRDIKRENLLIDATDYLRPQVACIDLGLSKRSTDIDIKGHVGGTPYYLSPEAWLKQNTTAASDIFAVGVTLALLWGAIFGDKVIAGNQVEFLDTLFSGVDGLTPEIIRAMRTVIGTMCADKPCHRGSLMDVAKQLELLVFRYNTCLLNEGDKTQMRKVRALTAKLRTDIATAFEVLNVLTCASKVALEIANTLLQIPDNPLFIEQFVTLLDIRAFHGLLTRLDINDKVETIVDEYMVSREAVNRLVIELKDVLDSDAYNQYPLYYQGHLQNICQHALRCLFLYPETFDQMAELGKKFTKHHNAIWHELFLIKRSHSTMLTSVVLVRPLPGRVAPAGLYKLFTHEKVEPLTVPFQVVENTTGQLILGRK
jgi:hypothetical protein